MASEIKRGFIRIASNYGRLAATLILSLIYVPYMVNWLGLEAFGLISLLGATVGLAALLREIINQSMLREIAAAYHSGDEQHFRQYYSSAYGVAAGITALTLPAFVVLILIIPLLRIPPEWHGAARWIIGAQAVTTCLQVFAAPTISMYQVREQFGFVNTVLVLERSTMLAAAVLLAWGFGIDDTARGLMFFGLTQSGLLCCVIAFVIAFAVLRDRRLLPSPSLIRRQPMRRILGTFGWNSLVRTAIMFYWRAAAVVMNLAFGVFGNGVFELGHRLVSYARMTTNGITQGLDAVSARVSADPDSRALQKLLYHSTRLQGLVALPCGLGVILLAGPLLHLWIGQHVENPETVIPMATGMVWALAFAITTHSIVDGWLLILYGAGYVRRYAPLLCIGSLFAPALGVALLFTLPENLRYYAPAIGCAVVYVIVNFLLLPIVGARCLSLRYRDLFLPLIRPFALTVISSPLLIAAILIVNQWTLPLLLAVILGYGVIYAAGSWLIVLKGDERRRLVNAVRRRMPIPAR